MVQSAQPFRSAVFICEGLPLRFLVDQGYEVFDAAKDYDKRSGRALPHQTSFTALLQEGNEKWDNGLVEEAISMIASLTSGTNICGLTKKSPLVFISELISAQKAHLYDYFRPRKNFFHLSINFVDRINEHFVATAGIRSDKLNVQARLW